MEEERSPVEQDAAYITGLSNSEFADEFDFFVKKIEKDPIKNFIEHPLFMHFSPTPAQRVALKTIFCQELDDSVKHTVWMETKNSEGDFDLEIVEMTEVELYRYMTDRDYDVTTIKIKNKINFIVGRRGGKCQDVDSKIVLADGSRVRIGDLIGKEFQVVAYDEKTGKRVISTARGIDNGVKQIFRVTTKSGFTLERTGNHPLMTPRGWVNVADLKAGNHLQVPRVNEVFGTQSSFSKDELKLLGYFIGDGSLSGGNCGYTQLDNVCAREFCSIIENAGGRIRVYQKEGSRCKTFSPSGVKWLRPLLRRTQLWGKTSPYKFVPDDIFSSPKEDIALFLNRLFSTDGSLYFRDKGRIGFEYSSASKRLVEDIKHLLQRFGVMVTLKSKRVKYKNEMRTYFRIYTSDSASVQTLISDIGILGKSEKFENFCCVKNISTNHPLNSVPEFFFERVKTLQKEKNFTDAEVVFGEGHTATRADYERLRTQYKAGKDKILKYFKNLDYGGVEKTIVSDFWFDEIESVELIGDRPTAGIEVDGYHTYVNDVVEHNTTLTAMLAIYCAIVTNWKPYLHKTPFATVLILSHSKEFSDEVLEIVRNMIEQSVVLKRLINTKKKNTASTMNLSVPFIQGNKIVYSRVQIKVGAASSKTTRGIAACAVICDEIAFWNLDENMKETDEKILRAVRPAMKQFGKRAYLFKLSSPGIKQGILYTEHQKWQKGTLPQSYVVFKAPSWVWNTILPKEEFVEEWELDQDGFNSEYRANFVDSISFFIQPEFIDMAVLKGVVFQPPEPKKSQVVYRAAIDAAFKKDHFTFSVIGHFENRVKQYVLKGWEGSKKKPVEARECAEYIHTICKEYGIDEVAADQYAYEPLREIFQQYGVTLKERTFTITFKKQIYYNLKRLIHSQQIDLLDHERCSKELKELVIEQTGSGLIRVGHPPGGSDDYADSTAISAFLAVESAGQVGYSLETTLDDAHNHNIKTDREGRAFVAPSAPMLSDMYGYSIYDNSHEYERDPKTGRLTRRKETPDDDPEDDAEGPQFVV